jgi:hypothetical protein
MDENHLIHLRDEAMRAAVSSVNWLTDRRKAVADYIRAMRKAGKQYGPRLFHDMATIKHGFGMLKTSYRKIMARAHPDNPYWK